MNGSSEGRLEPTQAARTAPLRVREMGAYRVHWHRRVGAAHARRLSPHGVESCSAGSFARAVAFLKKEDGPTAVEYAVMLALILVAIFAAVANIGGYDERHVQQSSPARGQATVNRRAAWLKSLPGRGRARTVGWCPRGGEPSELRTTRNCSLYTNGRSNMRSLTKNLVSFLKKEDGPTAVEYAVMLALIIVVCIAAITTLGSQRQRDLQLRRLLHQAPDHVISGLGPDDCDSLRAEPILARLARWWRPSASHAARTRSTTRFPIPPLEVTNRWLLMPRPLDPANRHRLPRTTRSASTGRSSSRWPGCRCSPSSGLLAAVVAHQVWAAVSPTGLNAGPLVVVCFGMILAAFIDGWALKVPNWVTLPADPQRLDARPAARLRRG